jgi:hypothetical protein
MRDSSKDGGAFDKSMAARTPGRDVFGPLDDHLPEVRIPADVKVDVMRAAAAQGHDISGWLRELVYGSIYGPEHVARMYEQRITRVLGNARRSNVAELPVRDNMRNESRSAS